MDGRTKPNEFYVVDRNNNASNEDNEENSNELINDTKAWGEDGTSTKLINIATTTNGIPTIKTNVDGQEELPRYYVEEPTSPSIIENIRTDLGRKVPILFPFFSNVHCRAKATDSFSVFFRRPLSGESYRFFFRFFPTSIVGRKLPILFLL
jgi:hypothetical protein